MKHKWINIPQEFKRNKEIRYSDVKSIECYCFGCGNHLGGIDYIDTRLSYMLHIPLCNDCWKKTGMKFVEPKVK